MIESRKPQLDASKSMTADEVRTELNKAVYELKAAQEFKDSAWVAEAQQQVEFYQAWLERLEAQSPPVRCGKCQRLVRTRTEQRSRCCDRCFTQMLVSSKLGAQIPVPTAPKAPTKTNQHQYKQNVFSWMDLEVLAS